MQSRLSAERTQHYYRRARQFVELMVVQLRDIYCQKSAAQLTYVTLFALVPLMTVTYSMFSAVPAFRGLGEDLQELIFANMVPEAGYELLDHLQEFSQQARRLTLVGVAFLVGSAYLMLVNVERNFNLVWGVTRGRRGLSKFLLYWAVLTLGPLLLGAGLAITTYLASLRLFMDGYEALGILTWLFELTPWLLTSATFTLLFAAVPNCKVPLKHAILGGMLAGFAFELLKVVFGVIVANSAIATIYGAFAIVPLFLLWVNITWLIILAGAVFVHTIGIYQVALRERGYPDLMAALVVLWHFYQRSAEGKELNDSELLQLGLSSEQWRRVCDALQRERWIAATNGGGFVLCRDLHKHKVSQLIPVLEVSRMRPSASAGLEALPWYSAFTHRLEAIDQFSREQLDLTFAAVFEATDSDDGRGTQDDLDGRGSSEAKG